MFRRLDEGNVKRQFQLDIDRHNAQYTPFYKLYAPSQANCPQTADDFRQYRRIVFTSGYSIQISLWHIILLVVCDMVKHTLQSVKLMTVKYLYGIAMG